MNTFQLYRIIIVLALFSPAIVSAQPPPPILVDEFGRLGCEDFSSRMDAWIHESQRRAELVPYAVVRGPSNDLLERITYREWIKGQLTFRFASQAYRERFRIVEGELTAEPRVEFWLLSEADPRLRRPERRWDLSLKITKTVPYYQSQGDGGICPPIDHTAVFKQLINANPALRGRIIFHERRWKKFLQEKREFLEKDPQVTAERFSFARPRPSDSFYDRHFEYWFVPIRR